jgi:hypothetical protein
MNDKKLQIRDYVYFFLNKGRLASGYVSKIVETTRSVVRNGVPNSCGTDVVYSVIYKDEDGIEGEFIGRKQKRYN